MPGQEWSAPFHRSERSLGEDFMQITRHTLTHPTSRKILSASALGGAVGLLGARRVFAITLAFLGLDFVCAPPLTSEIRRDVSQIHRLALRILYENIDRRRVIGAATLCFAACEIGPKNLAGVFLTIIGPPLCVPPKPTEHELKSMEPPFRYILASSSRIKMLAISCLAGSAQLLGLKYSLNTLLTFYGLVFVVMTPVKKDYFKGLSQTTQIFLNLLNKHPKKRVALGAAAFISGSLGTGWKNVAGLLSTILGINYFNGRNSFITKNAYEQKARTFVASSIFNPFDPFNKDIEKALFRLNIPSGSIVVITGNSSFLRQEFLNQLVRKSEKRVVFFNESLDEDQLYQMLFQAGQHGDILYCTHDISIFDLCHQYSGGSFGASSIISRSLSKKELQFLSEQKYVTLISHDSLEIDDRELFLRKREEIKEEFNVSIFLEEGQGLLDRWPALRELRFGQRLALFDRFVQDAVNREDRAIHRKEIQEEAIHLRKMQDSDSESDDD